MEAGFFSGGTFRVKHDKAFCRPAPSAYPKGHGETHIVFANLHMCACALSIFRKMGPLSPKEATWGALLSSGSSGF